MRKSVLKILRCFAPDCICTFYNLLCNQFQLTLARMAGCPESTATVLFKQNYGIQDFIN